MDVVSDFDPHASIYESGRAIGQSDIRTDTMTFRFRDELFTFPTARIFGVARFNGYFWEANIDDIRMLATAGEA